ARGSMAGPTAKKRSAMAARAAERCISGISGGLSEKHARSFFAPHLGCVAAMDTCPFGADRRSEPVEESLGSQSQFRSHVATSHLFALAQFDKRRFVVPGFSQVSPPYCRFRKKSAQIAPGHAYCLNSGLEAKRRISYDVGERPPGSLDGPA